MLYCCKKCVDGVIKKYTSVKSCGETGGVPCKGADPICGGGIRRGGAVPGGIAPGGPIAQSHDPDRDPYDPDPDPGPGFPSAAPCAGGVLGKNVRIGTPPNTGWALLTPCGKGTYPKKAGDGRIWCCPITAPGTAGCQSDSDCPSGQRCVDGTCKDEAAAGCEGGHLLGAGQSQCGEGFELNVIGGANWCCPPGWDDDGDGGNGNGDGNGGGGDVLGEFNWSPELKALLSRLMERFKYLSDYPRGTTPQERQAIINYAMKGVKRGERGKLQSSKDQLARMGLLGSGFELSEADKIRRGTGEMTSNIQSVVAIDELDRRFNELMGTTGAMGGIMNTLFSGEQIPEVLSAGRRGESQNALSLMISYLSVLMGGQQNNPYWAGIFNQMGGGQRASGSFWDWLPYLGMLT